jgi:signal peptidase I
MATDRKPAKKEQDETDIVGTVMSLTIAFTLAMAFRGFVLEGFVIPTGSMGPTLMGEHVRLLSPVTAYEYPADSQVQRGMVMTGDGRPVAVVDPMISSRKPIEQRDPATIVAGSLSGDRVAVLKPLYAFSSPERWDVVVFKNPPDPVGMTQNYIKRLVGLPNETVLLLDGDVFTGPLDAAPRSLRIERKPEHVQRALWQPVHDSDYEPVVPLQALETGMRSPWAGVPWKPAGAEASWKLAPSREWVFSGTGQAALQWSGESFPLDDWNSYNALRMAYAAMQRFPQGIADMTWRQGECFPVSDLRVCASIECGAMKDFSTTLELVARNAVMELTVRGSGEAEVVRRHAETGERLGSEKGAFAPRSDGLLLVELWHVDQQLWVFVGGSPVVRMPYDYGSLDDRITASMFGRTVEQYVQRPADTRMPTPPRLSWRFETSAPFTLRRVRVDRDLYYRPVLHDANNQYSVNGEYVTGTGFACNYESPARLGPTDHLMLGDNSAASRDARLWGRAHPLSLRTFGDAQPGVVPRDMIVGKAFFVYFPSSRSRGPGQTAFIPDFGRMRFIR